MVGDLFRLNLELEAGRVAVAGERGGSGSSGVSVWVM